MIAPCLCTHAAQDKLHGRGNRVFNPTNKSTKDTEVGRCTVCGTERSVKRAVPLPEEKRAARQQQQEPAAEEKKPEKKKEKQVKRK